MITLLQQAFGCIPLGWSGSGSLIQDHSDHCASKELMNPPWSRIHRFLWWTMMILNLWTWSRSPQSNAPYVLHRCRAVGTCDREKIDFSCINFTFYSILKNISIVSLSLTNCLLNTTCEVCHEEKRKQKNKQQCFTLVHFRLACWATCNKTA